MKHAFIILTTIVKIIDELSLYIFYNLRMLYQHLIQILNMAYKELTYAIKFGPWCREVILDAFRMFCSQENTK